MIDALIENVLEEQEQGEIDFRQKLTESFFCGHIVSPHPDAALADPNYIEIEDDEDHIAVRRARLVRHIATLLSRYPQHAASHIAAMNATLDLIEVEIPKAQRVWEKGGPFGKTVKILSVVLETWPEGVEFKLLQDLRKRISAFAAAL